MDDKARGKLMDCRQIQDEIGISRTAAEAIMRKLPKVTIEGLRKVYVRRADVEHYIEERTEAA